MEYNDKIPLKKEFFPLYTATQWNERLQLNPDQLERAISNSYFVVSVYENKQLIGFGRVVSDGVAYATLYDVMVDPKWQKQGIGSQIIRRLVEKCQLHDIRRIYLFAAKDAENYFQRFGFAARPSSSRGMSYEKIG